MIVWATAKWPMEQTIFFADRQVIDAGVTVLHQAVFNKFPVFVPVRAEPVSAIIAPFVGVAHSDPVFGERPQFFDQAVFVFAYPFAGQKRLGLVAVGDEMRAVAPFGIKRIGSRDFRCIAAIPAIFGKANLLSCGFTCKTVAKVGVT